MDALLTIGLIALWVVVFLLVAVAGLVVGVVVYVFRAVLRTDAAGGPDLL